MRTSVLPKKKPAKMLPAKVSEKLHIFKIPDTHLPLTITFYENDFKIKQYI